MQVEITLTINVPDGIEPTIKVVKTLKDTAKKHGAGLPTVGTKATPKPSNPNYFNGKPKNKIAERKCLQCGHKFMPNTHNHKFDTKVCKDKYNYKQNHEEKKPKAIPKKTVPKKEVATTKQKKMHGSEVLFSKDPFYIQQLQKANRQHGQAYSRYVGENKL
jgi:hypothetical protein